MLTANEYLHSSAVACWLGSSPGRHRLRSGAVSQFGVRPALACGLRQPVERSSARPRRVRFEPAISVRIEFKGLGVFVLVVPVGEDVAKRRPLEGWA